ncbi:NTPase KAP family P-loop domain-containing protein 1-like [Elgaria multicarinata webbii]|uniref:NTPase KAP family P-loop domain-containing protein 1-like n=1 Tax=Elgaria multicarinata webbii TaxID=159646 RepID=UPI002FCCD3EA
MSKGCKIPTKERKADNNHDIYCKALAQTLKDVDLPVTVGLYSPWGQQKRKFLDKIEDYMTDKPKNDGKRMRKICSGLLAGWSWLLLNWHIIFCHFTSDLPSETFYEHNHSKASKQPRTQSGAIPQGEPTLEEETLLSEKSSPPIPRSEETEHNNIQCIFINFSAWDYVGCDYIWAGLVTTLLDEIEGKFKYSFGAFRMFGAEYKGKPMKNKWIVKTMTKVSFFGIVSVSFAVTLGAWLLIEENLLEIFSSVIASAVSLCGIPFIFPCKNLFFTVRRKIQNEIRRKDLSVELGFMHYVKKEVKTIVKFLQLMAFKNKRKIRVVLKITNLDLCAPDKVVAVLDAVSILLSDKDAPFMSILAADSSILVECIQQSSNTWSNGYLYLDRIVSLPFSLPQMSHQGKTQLKQDIKRRLGDMKLRTSPSLKNYRSQKAATMIVMTEDSQCVVYELRTQDLGGYLSGNFVQMERIVNTVLTIYSMITQGYTFKDVEIDGGNEGTLGICEVIDWVILANCWPCRLSWILQCEENDRQRRKLDQSSRMKSDAKTLYQIFEDHEFELGEIKNDIKNLLELDGDPELFKIFLRDNESHFTAKWVRCISHLLINLDFSLKRQLELHEGLKCIPTGSKGKHLLESKEC